ncbi:hypothetical protein EXIGLDRAFT_761970 [Exidia glandulosa HHB12029]|uniref:Uncharacterized protein n=1 Tax=Exidia glandulosa HHB12029 TaxID=1314781 RepID=A0A165N281_EXIGL|nr:hypothetical protein EXIGLDRAFT_761970 [Exidia glandulosa HHB12029]
MLDLRVIPATIQDIGPQVLDALEAIDIMLAIGLMLYGLQQRGRNYHLENTPNPNVVLPRRQLNHRGWFYCAADGLDLRALRYSQHPEQHDVLIARDASGIPHRAWIRVGDQWRTIANWTTAPFDESLRLCFKKDGTASWLSESTRHDYLRKGYLLLPGGTDESRSEDGDRAAQADEVTEQQDTTVWQRVRRDKHTGARWERNVKASMRTPGGGPTHSGVTGRKRPRGTIYLDAFMQTSNQEYVRRSDILVKGQLQGGHNGIIDPTLLPGKELMFLTFTRAWARAKCVKQGRKLPDEATKTRSEVATICFSSQTAEAGSVLRCIRIAIRSRIKDSLSVALCENMWQNAMPASED